MVLYTLIQNGFNIHTKEDIVVADKPKLTYDKLELPSYEDALKKTFPDLDDFDCLYGKMGASDELAQFTKVINYKVKLDPPENGRDYLIKQMPMYPKFLALFEGKKSVSEITLFDVNRMFSKVEFEKSLEEDERNNSIANASAEIMDNMKKENRFAFDVPLKDSDLEILRKHIKDTEGFKNYGDLLSDSFRDMLPDFAKIGEESGIPLDFNPTADMFFPDNATAEEGDEDVEQEPIFKPFSDDYSPEIGGGSFMPTPEAWKVEED